MITTKKYELTNNTKTYLGKTLYQIKALASFGNIAKGELGGYIEKEDNLAQVYDNAWVSGDAQVYGNAKVSARASFTLGWFIGGDDTGKIAEITSQTGSNLWNHQYVLGDYKIEPIGEPEEVVEELTMEEICKALGKNVKIKK